MNRFAALFLASLALAGCASSASSPATKARIRADLSNDRNQDSVRRMQDEFNALTGDAS